MVSGIAPVKKPLTLTIAPAGAGVGYGFSITMTGSNEEQQAVYDYAYSLFGHNAARWSISGAETFYVDGEADANALKAKFDPAPEA
jgi:hypothetical protein